MNAPKKPHPKATQKPVKQLCSCFLPESAAVLDSMADLCYCPACHSHTVTWQWGEQGYIHPKEGKLLNSLPEFQIILQTMWWCNSGSKYLPSSLHSLRDLSTCPYIEVDQGPWSLCSFTAAGISGRSVYIFILWS